ncbi:aspartate aminotransferase family protein [Fictibacillus gelatini]|uniref:aspartate aminotransferase family protein n=1 Tax=Fictibacillus gelatini TaxID=225985 RepID=UPI000419B213|nr:aminotransferase class III-fold pyridoxal phosphate-dependent enzyme [Fictibacillus gelatini]
MDNWMDLDKIYMMSAYERLPVAITGGEGSTLYDVNGRAYLDLFSGVGVNLLGYGHPEIMKAATEQVANCLHLPFHFLNPVAIKYAKKLVDHSLKAGKVFFTTSGAEATESTIKLIHKFKQKAGDVRDGIVVLKNSFHGRTLGALPLTRQKGVYQDYPCHSITIHEVEREDVDGLVKVIHQQHPIAVMIEPVMGSGGIYPLSGEYIRKIEELCRENHMLFIVDEVQCGMGRTGKLFAYQHHGVTPDIVQFGKGAGGGAAFGGIIAGPRVHDCFAPGDHGTTFAQPPLSTALGLAVLKVLLDDGMMEKGYETSQYLYKKLSEIQKKHADYITDLRYSGMMFGMSVNDTAANVKKIQRKLLNDGMLVDVTQGNIIRLLPPLVLTKQEVDRFIDAFQSHLPTPVLAAIGC